MSAGTGDTGLGPSGGAQCRDPRGTRGLTGWGLDPLAVPDAGTVWGTGTRALPSLDAHCLRTWEKQKDGTWCRIPWETPGRRSQTAQVLHRRLDERSKPSGDNTRELLVFFVSRETKDGFEGGRCRGKRFMSV